MIKHDALVNNILAVYLSASDTQVNAGLSWYSEAAEFARDLGATLEFEFGMQRKQTWFECASAIIAILSPMKSWETNKKLAISAVDQVIRGFPVTGTYSAQCRKVEQAVLFTLKYRGEYHALDLLDIISNRDAQKTRRFFSNIIGISSCVTVDGHAANIANYGTVRKPITSVEMKRPRRALYDTYERAYLVAARVVELTPSQLQAITWVAYREMKNEE